MLAEIAGLAVTPLPANIETQINLNKPICVRVLWTGGHTAHLFASTGYSVSSSDESTFTIYLQTGVPIVVDAVQEVSGAVSRRR